MIRRTRIRSVSEKKLRENPNSRWGIARGPGPTRKVRPKAKNARRRKSEFARAYGSKERVAFVKSLGCVCCTALSPFLGIASVGTSHNAHTITGGGSRKADADTIVPLCASHHRMYDQRRRPLADPRLRQAIKDAAAEVERRWQDLQRGAA